MRQFIPRKSHSTHIKLYVLGDRVHPFISDIFLYAGKRFRVFWDQPEVARPRTARDMVHQWADVLPTRTAVVCDSYFGSHLVANQMAQRQHPFLFLCKRDEEGVSLAGDGMRPSTTAEPYVKGAKYSLHVYKNPKVGSKPPRMIPFLSNFVFDSEWLRHRGRYELPPVVAVYRQLPNCVDSAHQSALEQREIGQFKSSTRALKAFLFRYAIVNPFIVLRLQGFIPKKKSLWDFQWDISENFVSLGQTVHTPVLVDTRGTCKVCKGRIWFKCALCDVHLHSYGGCFNKWHGDLTA